MKKLLPLFLILASCNQAKDQWVLQSYDRNKGYIFVRNGVEYETTCLATGRPTLGAPPNQTADTNPDALPPDIAHDETDCGDVLLYLHKPVPSLRQVGGSILVFTEVEEKNYKLEFEIKHAK